MFKLKKVFSILLLALSAVAISSLVSCSKGDTEGSGEEITFWHFWSEPSQRQAVMDLIEQFEKENNCKVNTTELSWNDGQVKLFAAFNSNTAPDVLDLGSDWIAQFSSKGVLQELNPKAHHTENFDENFLVPGRWNSKQYAIPWVVNSRVIFYNKDLFKRAGLPEEAPKTLDEMYKYAEAINSLGNGVYGFGVNGSDPHRLYKKILPFIWTYGGKVIDDNGEVNFLRAENIKAVEMYKKLSQVGIIETQKKLDDMFARGEIGIWISGSWLIEKIKATTPFLNYSVALFPGVTPDRKGISFAGAEYLAINKSTKNLALAEKFVNFMTKGENALKLCKAIKEAGFPADKAYHNDKYFQTLPLMPIFAEQLKHSKLTPVHPKWLDIEAKLENVTMEILYGKKGSYEAFNYKDESDIRE